MASRLIFDTNYLRKLGSREYLEGKIPPKLEEQIALALNRGDIVCIPRTVQFELNAWVKEISQKEFESIKRSMDVLLENGYSVVPSVVEVASDIDTLEIIKGKFSDVYILEPSIENYVEAERRTSFREAPMPKNPQGEEFRDRLIWCQVLSQNSDLPSVIVSEDKIFENGVATKEGLDAKVSIIKTEEELNQWLDNRPDHIQTVIDDVLLFSNELKAQTVDIDEDEIVRVVDYRAVNEPNGVILKKFLIVTKNDQDETISWSCKIYYQGKTPVSLNIQVNGHTVNIQRELTVDEQREVLIEKNTKVYEQQFQEDELRRLIGG
jgi:hypothetical protein